MIICLCVKHESNTVIFSKDNERKPFLVRDVRRDSGDTKCPLIEIGGALKMAGV